MRHRAIITAMLTPILLGMLIFVFFVSQVDQSTEFLVGASYMTFWGTGMDIDWSSGAVYWPTVGNYSSNDVTIANRHIEMALNASVDFFFFDYGWGNAAERRLMEDAAIKGLLNSCNIRDFSFCIFYYPYNAVNSDFVNETTLQEDFSHINENYTSHSRYLRLDNRSVIILADFPLYLNKDLSYEEINSLFLGLRERYRLYLIPAFWPDRLENASRVLSDSRSVYDAITLWGNTTIIEFNKTISYSEYVSKTGDFFKNWSALAVNKSVDFVPLISPGFDNVIYYGMKIRDWWAIVTRDPKGFHEVCELAKSYSSPPHNMILLFTWNDFKEGTSIEPTTDYRYTYLDIISSTLCTPFPFNEELIGKTLLYGILIAVAVIIVVAFLMKRKRYSVLSETKT